MTGTAPRVLRLEGLAREPRLLHGISTRPENASFSVGAGHGDPSAGRRRLLEAVRIDPMRTVVAGQVHGARVAWVDAKDAGAGALVKGTAIPETDGLATGTPGVGLLLTSADCPTVLLFDREVPLLAAVHSGWRGTAARIVPAAVELLAERGASRDRLVAGIGPGIGACCYEVGDEVIERVPAKFRDRLLAHRKLDLGGWIELQLREAGIARIERSPLCSACRLDLFFSHRAEKGRCGRVGVVAAIR